MAGLAATPINKPIEAKYLIMLVPLSTGFARS
jgi:hypothetical protein